MLDWDTELSAFLQPFLEKLGHKKRRQMCPLYVSGLIGPGDRKSIGPMAERFAPGQYDRLHHFISDGLWDAVPLETELALQADRIVGASDAFLVIDDTGLPKKGDHSVGVAPQYASMLGKRANCQTLVSITLARDEVPVPVGLRLFLPDSWIGDQERMAKAGVPDDMRVSRTKPEIALAEIDRLIVTGVRFGTVLADAGYGLSAAFRKGLSERGLTWAVGIPKHQKVYSDDVGLIFPVSGHGRPRKHSIPDTLSVAAETMLASASWKKVSWRRGTKGRLTARFAASRVRIADGTPQRIYDKGQQHMPGEAAWLVGEWRAKILPVQLASRCNIESAGDRDQGEMGLRTGPSADERGTRSRSLRRPIVARAAPARSDDDDRLRVPPAPEIAGCKAGKKRSDEFAVVHLNRPCQPSVEP